MYIIQHDYRDDIAHMNRWNIEDRHCRIGKVKWRPAEPLFGVAKSPTLESEQDPRNPNRRVLWLVSE